MADGFELLGGEVAGAGDLAAAEGVDDEIEAVAGGAAEGGIDLVALLGADLAVLVVAVLEGDAADLMDGDGVGGGGGGLVGAGEGGGVGGGAGVEEGSGEGGVGEGVEGKLGDGEEVGVGEGGAGVESEGAELAVAAGVVPADGEVEGEAGGEDVDVLRGWGGRLVDDSGVVGEGVAHELLGRGGGQSCSEEDCCGKELGHGWEVAALPSDDSWNAVRQITTYVGCRRARWGLREVSDSGYGVAPSLIRQDDGGGDLTVGDVPVLPEQLILGYGIDDLEAVTLVEADGPDRIGPGTDQHGPAAEGAKVKEQIGADSLLLRACADVGVADEVDVEDCLNAHDRRGCGVFVVGPEDDAGRDLVLESFPRHVRLGQAIWRDDPSVGLGAVVDDGPDLFEILGRAGANHRIQRI